MFLVSGIIGKKPRKFISERWDFHWSSFGCNIALEFQITLKLMGVYQGLTWWNLFMNRIFHLRDTCLWTHAYVRATIVVFAYNRFFLCTILVAKGLYKKSSSLSGVGLGDWSPTAGYSLHGTYQLYHVPSWFAWYVHPCPRACFYISGKSFGPMIQ